MTYKEEGDELLADDILQKVYTYQIFMCNDPKNILSKFCHHFMLE